VSQNGMHIKIGRENKFYPSDLFRCYKSTKLMGFRGRIIVKGKRKVVFMEFIPWHI